MPRKPAQSKPQIVSLQKANPPQSAAPTATEEEVLAAACRELGFGVGKMRELSEAVKKAEAIQGAAQQLMAELSATQIEAHDLERTIIYCCDGQQKPTSIRIEPEAIAKYSAAELSKQVLLVMQGGYRQSKKHMTQKIYDLTTGLDLPGEREMPVISPVEGVVVLVREGD